MMSLTGFAVVLYLLAVFQGVQAKDGRGEESQEALASSGTSTSSSASPSPSTTTLTSAPSTLLIFVLPSQFTTCGSSLINWGYVGPSNNPITLSVTNAAQAQNIPTPQISLSSSTSSTAINRAPPTSPPPIEVIIAANITPSLLQFDWNPVDVPPGRYILIATTTTTTSNQFVSSPFYIHSGTNTSCLASSSSSSSSTTLAPSSTSTSSPTFMSSSSTPSSVADNNNNNGTSSSNSRITVGTAVGVSVGMGAFLLAVVAAWFFIYRKAKLNAAASGRSSAKFGHQWNGLGSTDSRGGFGAPNASKSKGYHRSSRTHLRSLPGSVATTGLGHDYEDEDEDDGILGAEKNQGKTSFFEDHGVALSALPVLHHQPSQGPTTHSASSSTSNVLLMNDHGPPTARRSVGKLSMSMDAYPPSVSSPLSSQAPQAPLVAPDMYKSYSQSTTGSTQLSSSLYSQHHPYQEQSSSSSTPPSESPLQQLPPVLVSNRESKQLHRQSLGRKRKPVPAYDPDNNELATSPTTTPTTATFFPTAPAPVGDHELVHKSSFGIDGKPVHYLIPDMPMNYS